MDTTKSDRSINPGWWRGVDVGSSLAADAPLRGKVLIMGEVVQLWGIWEMTIFCFILLWNYSFSETCLLKRKEKGKPLQSNIFPFSFLCPFWNSPNDSFERIFTFFMILSFLTLDGFLGGSDSKEFAYSTGDPDSIPGLGRPPRERNGNPPLYSCLEHSMDRGAWWATVQEAIFFRSKYSKAQDLFLKNLYSNAGSFR